MHLSEQNFNEIKKLFNKIKNEDFNEQNLRRFLFDILVVEAQEPSYLRTAILLQTLKRKKFSLSYNEKIIDSFKDIFDEFKALDKIERQIIRYLYLEFPINSVNKAKPFKVFVEKTTSKTSLIRQILLSSKKYKTFFYNALENKKYFIKKLHLLKATRINTSFSSKIDEKDTK